MQAREAAFLVLKEVEEGAYANLSLDKFLTGHKLSAPDRALMTEIVYGTVKYRNKLDWIIDKMVKKAGSLSVGARLLLRLSFYQVLFLDKVPVSAVTNEGVKLARKYFHAGVAGLVNGVLRSYLRLPEQVSWPDKDQDPLTYLEVVYSHPRWMVQRWLLRYGFADTEKLCRFNNSPAPLWIRANLLRVSRDQLLEQLEKEGCAGKKSERAPEGLQLLTSPPVSTLPSFQNGLFTVQDESSMLAAHALNPVKGWNVLDVCAAPGGKTTHMAELMQDQGTILACDIHAHRLKLIEENAGRLGIQIIETTLQDASRIGSDRQGEQYQAVLVDAPCSGLGVLRRRPDSRWRKSEQDIAALARLQEEILESAAKLLAPGGRMVYSTCTTEPEENSGLIVAFMAKHPELKLTDNRQYLPFKDDMEGFFIAAMEKREGESLL